MNKAQNVDWSALKEVSPLFAALPMELRSAVRVIRLPQSSRLFTRGDRPGSMYFVLSGEMRLVRHSSAGHEFVLQRCQQGVLAEASLDQSSYHCNAVAAVPSVVLSIPRSAFTKALGELSFQRAWTEQLTRELRRARARVERLNLRTARERIVHYIELEGRRGSIALECTKKDWAAELGITHEALYRTLASMEREGQLAIRGATVTLTQ